LATDFADVAANADVDALLEDLLSATEAEDRDFEDMEFDDMELEEVAMS